MCSVRDALRSLQVVWQDKKGAGCMRSFSDTESCLCFAEKVRAEATILENRQKVGGVERFDGFDDSRRKWAVWIELE